MAVEKWKLAADAKALVKLQFQTLKYAVKMAMNSIVVGMKVIELEDNIDMIPKENIKILTWIIK